MRIEWVNELKFCTKRAVSFSLLVKSFSDTIFPKVNGVFIAVKFLQFYKKNITLPKGNLLSSKLPFGLFPFVMFPFGMHTLGNIEFLQIGSNAQLTKKSCAPSHTNIQPS
jgi:hypothetical protein